MSETSTKGDYGVAHVIADCAKRGYKVAIPMGEDWKYDLIVLRGDKLERVQVKYSESDEEVIKARTYRRDNRDGPVLPYKKDELDWFAIYDKTTDKCYYVSAYEVNEKISFAMRLVPPKNKQKERIKYAKDYLDF
jgi:hypothetical protein